MQAQDALHYAVALAERDGARYCLDITLKINEINSVGFDMQNELDEMSPIGVIAAKYGVTLRALRFYEEKGLLNPLRIGDHRLYNKATESQLSKILEAKRLGYSIRMIKDNAPLSRWNLEQDLDKDLLREKLRKLRKERVEITNTIMKIEKILELDDSTSL